PLIAVFVLLHNISYFINCLLLDSKTKIVLCVLHETIRMVHIKRDASFLKHFPYKSAMGANRLASLHFPPVIFPVIGYENKGFSLRLRVIDELKPKNAIAILVKALWFRLFV